MSNEIRESMQLQGYIRAYRVPDGWSEAENTYWWQRLSLREKSRYLVAEAPNLITNNGRAQVLTYIGGFSGSTTAFAQQFAIGTGAIGAVSPADTALANEVFRKAPTSYTVSGTQVDVLIQLGSTDAQVTFTNVGLFGNGATGTLGSGTMVTHSLFSFTKGSFAINLDYVLNLL